MGQAPPPRSPKTAIFWGGDHYSYSVYLSYDERHKEVRPSVYLLSCANSEDENKE